MSFVERVNQGESLTSWLNWLTEPPAVCWSMIMGDLSPSWKRVYWTLPEAFRTGPPSCAVRSMWTIHRAAWSQLKKKNPIQVRLLGLLQLLNPSDLPCLTKFTKSFDVESMLEVYSVLLSTTMCVEMSWHLGINDMSTQIVLSTKAIASTQITCV